MTCDRCGQRVNEVPKCEHGRLFLGLLPPFTGDADVRCAGCGHNFGPVRELIEAKEQVATLTRERDEARGWAEQRLDHIHLCQMANTTLTCELDEARKREHEHLDLLDTYRQIDDKARARIAELEKELLNGSELIEANEKLMNEEAKLRSEVERLYAANGLLLKGRDAARARIAELEKPRSILDGLRDGESIVVRLGGTWEWRKVGE